MTYESDYNMPLRPLRESYPWAKNLDAQAKAQLAIQMLDPLLLNDALLEGAFVNDLDRPLLIEAARQGNHTLAIYLVAQKADVNLAGHHILRQRRHALVRHMHHGHATLFGPLLTQQMDH